MTARDASHHGSALRASHEPFRPRLIAGEAAYEQLIEALVARRQHLGISCEVLDEVAGLPARYANKLENPKSESGRGLGKLSFGLMLQALGVKLLFVADDKALPRALCRERASRERRTNDGSSDRPHAAWP